MVCVRAFCVERHAGLRNPAYLSTQNVTPRPYLTPGKEPVPIVQEAGWASGPVWTGAENLAPHRDSIPGPSSP